MEEHVLKIFNIWGGVWCRTGKTNDMAISNPMLLTRLMEPQPTETLSYFVSWFSLSFPLPPNSPDVTNGSMRWPANNSRLLATWLAHPRQPRPYPTPPLKLLQNELWGVKLFHFSSALKHVQLKQRQPHVWPLYVSPSWRTFPPTPPHTHTQPMQQNSQQSGQNTKLL